MTKRTSPLNSSLEIKSPSRTSSNSETVEILHFSRHHVSDDTWHDHVDATWHPMGVTHGMSHVVHLCE